jgi:hypothetical protein
MPLLLTYAIPRYIIAFAMLRCPVKLTLILAVIFSALLGIHGLYAYASRADILFGDEPSDLFLALSVPIIAPAVEWISLKALSSWLIPAGLLIVAVILWAIQRQIWCRRIALPRMLSKIKTRLW